MDETKPDVNQVLGSFLRMRLEFFDFLEVFVWEVEDSETKDDARERCPEMVAGEKEHVDAVEEEPDAPPDEDETDDRREILSEIAGSDLVHTGM